MREKKRSNYLGELYLKRTIFVVLTFFISVIPAVAFDYGAVANGQFITEKIEDTSAKGKVTLAPWFSLPFDMPVLGTSDFHVSLGLSTILGGKLQFIPELFRLELAVQPLPALAVRAGRIPWQDPSRLVVKGAFDGIDAQYTFRKFSIGASALYTGFLYKETANINVSPGDAKDYTADLSFSEFGATYFAPRRLVASLYGEVPGFLLERGHLYAGLLAQFDLSGAEERYHTQYLLLRYTFVYKAFSLGVAGTAGLANTTADGMQVSFAASVDAGLLLPTSWDDRFSLEIGRAHV